MFSRSLVLGALFLLGINGQIIDFAANRDGAFGAFNFWPFTSNVRINFQGLQPWWKGSNVCVEKRIVGGNHSEEKNDSRQVELLDEIPIHIRGSLTFSSCYETFDKHECLTKTSIDGEETTHVVRYKCCHGFTRSHNFGEGCIKQADLEPLLDVLDKINATDFRRLLKTVGLDSRISDGNYTLFAPLNYALHNITDVVSAMNEVDVVRRDASDTAQEMMLNHIVPGFVDLNDYDNEDIIYGENDNNSIRLNYYPTPEGGKLVTANCARVVRANLFASNGFIHTVDNLIPTARQTINELLNSPEVSSFKEALDASKLTDMFKHDGHYTIFLPTNEAFNKLDERTRQKVFSGSDCAATILKHHMTPHTVCAVAIITNATVHNENGWILNMERLSEDEILLDGKAKFVNSDILLTNGVVHFVDTLIIPDSALPVSQALTENTKFLNLATEAGINLDELSNVTVFVPFDAAFDEPEAEKYLNEVKEDKEKLRELVLYHIARGQMSGSDLTASGILKTELEGKTLWLKGFPFYGKLFSKGFTSTPLIQCASLTRIEKEACSSVVHEIDKVLIPPTKTLLQLIEEDNRLSTFRSILEGTEIEEKLKDPNQNLTIMATTNYGFGRSKYNLKELRDDKKLAESILKKHLIRRPVCCQELGNGGEQIFYRWSPFSDSFISPQMIKDCNIMATNGVLHTTNAFLLQQPEPFF